MSKLQILNAANDLGILKLFFQAGLIVPEIKGYYEIYLQVQARVASGKKKEQAVLEVADAIGRDRRTVYRALEFMTAA